ncbi:hypothetical protein D9M70_483670 [compost metagenome]
MEFPIALHVETDIGKVDSGRRNAAVAQDEDAAGSVVGDGVLDCDLPVANTRVDDLEAGHDRIGGLQYICLGNARANQVALKDEGNLALGAWLDEIGLAEADTGVVVELHAVREEAEVRLVDAEHFLHGLAGDADLLADNLFTVSLAPLQHGEGDVISVVDIQRIGPGQRFDRFTVTQCSVEPLGQPLAQSRIV